MHLLSPHFCHISAPIPSILVRPSAVIVTQSPIVFLYIYRVRWPVFLSPLVLIMHNCKFSFHYFDFDSYFQRFLSVCLSLSLADTNTSHYFLFSALCLLSYILTPHQEHSIHILFFSSFSFTTPSFCVSPFPLFFLTFFLFSLLSASQST